MHYISTRGAAPPLSFEDALLTGLAPDGGLYVPATWPEFDEGEVREFRQCLSYREVACRVMAPFVGESVSADALETLVADAYRDFGHGAVAPLVQIDHRLWLMELFHGPTLAFKDIALQLVGRLFDSVLARRGRRVTIIGATSGDTGSAAIEACRDRDAIDIFILHPKGRTSEVQRRQMTTVLSPNVHNIAIEGTFDDCQDLVKAMFGDAAFRERLQLSAVNSINWARILAQIVYYVSTAVALGSPDRPVQFAVPTGNFGNVYASYAARRIGLPLEPSVIGSNHNDILPRALATGVLAAAPVTPTLSPSMDIQISSNFERYLFELFDRDAAAVTELMRRFRADGRAELPPAAHERAVWQFHATAVGDDDTLEAMRWVYRHAGIVVDPHTGVGVCGADRTRFHTRKDCAIVVAACAHPAKFPDAVERAIGVRPALPPRLADLYDRPERCTTLPAALAPVQAFVADHARIARGGGA